METKIAKLKRLRAIGKLGGLRGGYARALSLTPARRVEIARKANAARWHKPAPA